ncbi:MAG TPA: hypothetical protein DDW83_03840 [Peptococcaceae bacterium]|nr:hypothetical protein [Peptococcaceae bacterium]
MAGWSNMYKTRFSLNENGFTLMEMIVVLVIIGLLISCGISFYDGYIENAKIVKAKSQISVMQGGMDSWYAEHGCYPQTAEEQMLAGLDLEVEDPWGVLYQIAVEPAGTAYSIWTTNIVFHQNKVVIGSGRNGRSDEPALGDVFE